MRPRPKPSSVHSTATYTDEQREWLKFCDAFKRERRLPYMALTETLEAAKVFLDVDDLHRLIRSMAERIAAQSELLSKRAEVAS